MKFKGRPGDLTWGPFGYPVTQTQKAAVEGIVFMLSSLPRAFNQPDLWQNGFYSQNPATGAIIMGLDHHSVSIHRNGRVTANAHS
jgi:hypothetical protein